MTNAASTSNPSFIVDVGEVYPYPSHFVAPNFVTMKLSGKDTYNAWETQILCLLKSHHMYGFIDGQFPRPAGNGKEKVGDLEAWDASDSLVKCWILGTLSDGIVKKVVNRLRPKDKKTDFTAKDLWDELQRNYGPWVREQAVSETKSPTRQVDSVIEVISESEVAKSTDEPTEEKIRKEKIDEIQYNDFIKKWIYRSVLEGTIDSVIEEFGFNPLDKITNNGNTVLHVAVGSSTKNHELFKKLLKMTPDEYPLLDLVNSDGSSLLHVAAIGGNIEVVNILVERSPELLLAKDKEGHTPLALSVSNMHTKTSRCLFEHMKVIWDDAPFSGQSGEEIVVLAISCHDFRLAEKIINDYDAILPNSDAVLTALAQNFPCELKLERKVRPFVQDTFIIHEDAVNLLKSICQRIIIKDFSTNHREYYTNSIFEATRRNASTFIRCIMRQFPEAIWGTNEDGHNFIQNSVINRSEKIYLILYEMREYWNIYKTIRDPSGNNLLHLVARLAPANKLNVASGAALKLQRELQWFKEVERFVHPSNLVQKNLDDETPQMVFEREHKDLLIEGEEWIKKTAESYTITAGLIITIVFAAAITVPGGNNQESGIPVFTNNIAFIIFAISDAISLFTGVTSLLVFLLILTVRFTEQDFLLKLPTKLIIGLTMLFLSTTAMIIAFGATLFLVFGQRNLLMLILIGALACLPITSFVTLQYPLIVKLISDTYVGGIFVREECDYFY